MRVLFFGTSEFAVKPLEALHNNKDFEIVGIITQPDKPKGRGKKLSMPEIKVCALRLGYGSILFQPEKISDNSEFFEKIKSLSVDIGLVVSYGKILPCNLIELPKYNLINIHSSLLPKYRGASPIRSVIINGDKKTGNTIMKIKKELDCGDILLQKEIDILDSDDYESLSNKLSILGAEMAVDVLYKYKKDSDCCSYVQDHDKVVYTKKINKQDCIIDWNKSCIEIFNFIRGLCPTPVAYTYYNGKKLRIFKSEIYKENICDENVKIGQIAGIVKNTGFIVNTGEGFLLVTEVQPENSKRMPSQAFLCGTGQCCVGSLLSC